MAPLAVVGLAHQAAFGTAASSAGTIVRAQCSLARLARDATYIDPQGTHGSEYERDLRAEAGYRPAGRLRIYAASRATLALLLEHATHGQPTATQAAGDVLETGETGGVLSALALVGVRPGFNTSADFKLYATLADEAPSAGRARLSLYSDSARSALVAQGDAANGGTATLAEQNGSGLSGTVALGTVTATNASIIYSVVRVRPARASAIARYLTLFRDTGRELETLSDATVRALRFSTDGRSRLVVEAEIPGCVYAIGASALTVSVAAGEKECFARATITHNANSQSALMLAHRIEHDVVQHHANAAAPVALYKTGSRARIELDARFSTESRTIVNDGRAGTSRAVAISYSHGPKTLSFSYPACRAVSAELPELGEREYAKHRLELEARDDASQDPVSIYLDL